MSLLHNPQEADKIYQALAVLDSVSDVHDAHSIDVAWSAIEDTQFAEGFENEVKANAEENNQHIDDFRSNVPLFISTFTDRLNRELDEMD